MAVSNLSLRLTEEIRSRNRKRKGPSVTPGIVTGSAPQTRVLAAALIEELGTAATECPGLCHSMAGALPRHPNVPESCSSGLPSRKDYLGGELCIICVTANTTALELHL